ncbi:MAG: transferrin receptor-like dimerization domain-containing protein, partial [Ferruginibacter sp.]
FERKLSLDIVGAASAKAKKELLAKKTFTLAALGSGSDFSPFSQHIGIPSVDISFGGESDGGEYHSIYDSYDLYKKFKDPTFEYGIVLAKTAGHTILRFASAETLPFDFRNLQKTISKYVTEVMTLADDMRENNLVENQLINEKHYTIADKVNDPLLPPVKKDEVPFLNFASLQNALAGMEKSANGLNDSRNTGKLQADKKNELNKRLYKAEQMLLTKEGLPRRGWYRHAVYAPGFYTGYGVKTLPGIREAIEQCNWKEAQEQVEIAATTINNFSAYLDATVAGIK